MLKRSLCTFALLSGLALGIAIVSTHLHAASDDIVLYAADVTTIQGNWDRIASASAAGGQKMASTDYGWSAADAPLASPNDYFEATFNAPASTAFHVWIRLRAT